MEGTATEMEESHHFRTWEELEEVPAFESTLHWYEGVKQAWPVADLGLSSLEWGLGFLRDSLQVKRLAGSCVDATLADKIADWKEHYPILQKRPSKIIKITRHRSVRFVKNTTRSALNNFFGKFLMFMMDLMLGLLEGTMQFLEPRSSTTSEKHVQTSPISAEFNGQSSERKTREMAWVEKITDEDQGIFEQFRRFLLFPLTVVICFLRETRHFIHGSKHHKATSRGPIRKSTRSVKSKTMSPERLQEIHERRKVSPRKRLPSESFLGSLKNATLRLFGLSTSHVKQTDIRRFLTCSKHKSLNECSLLTCEKKKRKHPDLSDGSEDDLTNLDLDSYLSEDDPDYEPTDDDSTDVTIDSEEEVSEGELEVESSKDGAFKMIKEKSKPSSISDEKQILGDKTQDSKKTDSNKNEKAVMKGSFEIAETYSSVSKTAEKANPLPQTKPVEKSSKPAEKITDTPVVSLQPQRPMSESSGPFQPQRPPSVSNAPLQQMMSPHGNKSKHGKSGGPPKNVSSPIRHIKQHSCKTPENKENCDAVTSKELSKHGGGKSVSFVKDTQEHGKPANSGGKESDVPVKN